MALAAPSLFSMYQAPPLLPDMLVVGISQSGQSPDIVGVVAEARRQGSLTLAITNDPSSPLAAEAELVLDMMAGRQKHGSNASKCKFHANMVAFAIDDIF